MKKASITEAKNNLSGLIDGLKSGSPVLIVDRGRPVAQLEAVSSHVDAQNDGRLDRLVRAGVVRPARGAMPKSILSTPPPRAKGGTSALKTLLDERRTSR